MSDSGPDESYSTENLDTDTGSYSLDDEDNDGPRGGMVGGDDPDAIPADQDFLGGSGQRSGRLVAPDEGAHEDIEKDSVAQDVGFAGAAASAEEAAMHVVDEADLDSGPAAEPDSGRAAEPDAADDDRR